MIAVRRFLLLGIQTDLLDQPAMKDDRAPNKVEDLERLLSSPQSASEGAHASAGRFPSLLSMPSRIKSSSRERRRVAVAILSLLLLSFITVGVLHRERLVDTLAKVCPSRPYADSQLDISARPRVYGEPEGDGLPFIPLVDGPACERTLLISLDGSYGMGSTFTLLLVSPYPRHCMCCV